MCGRVGVRVVAHCSAQPIRFKIFKWVVELMSAVVSASTNCCPFDCTVTWARASTYESCWYASIIPFDKTLIETSPLLRSKRFGIFYIRSLFSVAAAAVQTYYIVYVLLNRSHSIWCPLMYSIRFLCIAVFFFVATTRTKSRKRKNGQKHACPSRTNANVCRLLCLRCFAHTISTAPKFRPLNTIWMSFWHDSLGDEHSVGLVFAMRAILCSVCVFVSVCVW